MQSDMSNLEFGAKMIEGFCSSISQGASFLSTCNTAQMKYSVRFPGVGSAKMIMT